MTEEKPGLVCPFLAAIHGIPLPPPSDNILSLRLYSRVLHREQGEERLSSRTSKRRKRVSRVLRKWLESTTVHSY